MQAIVRPVLLLFLLIVHSVSLASSLIRLLRFAACRVQQATSKSQLHGHAQLVTLHAKHAQAELRLTVLLVALAVQS